MECEAPVITQHVTGAAGALPAERHLLSGCLELVGTSFSYGREEEIFGEGEEADFIYRVVTGAVRTCKVLSDGRRQIEAFHLPGDLFGFESGACHGLTAEAVCGTTVLLFRRRQMEEVASRNVEAACRLWTLALRSLGHAQEHMILLGRRTALERVAAFLMHMDARLGGTGCVELPMTRRDIADNLGLTLETVSRSFSQLQAEGALSLSGVRKVKLHRGHMLRMLTE